MLYIFDLGNVIVDIDFKRVIGVWSKLSGVPLARISSDFTLGEPFKQYERGEISDSQYAEAICHELNLTLSYEQFVTGWQAIFTGLRPEVIDIMQKLGNSGHRVVVLSNTNALHSRYWPNLYPEIARAAHRLYLSQELGMRKPEVDIYRYVLEQEGYAPEDALFFDDHPANITGAEAAGIKTIWVKDKTVIPQYFS